MPAGDQRHYSQAHSLRLALDYRLNRLLQKFDLLHCIGRDQRTLPFYRIETSHQIIPVISKFASFYMLKLALARRMSVAARYLAHAYKSTAIGLIGRIGPISISRKLPSTSQHDVPQHPVVDYVRLDYRNTSSGLM